MRLSLALPHAASRIVPYEPPVWAKGILKNEPTHGRLQLANLPTPIYSLSGGKYGEGSFLNRFQSMGINFFIKRDDMTGGVELGGNKVRKLEFLLAEALEEGYDSVVTIGGEQSNHCRATAGASRMVGLEPHLILRTPRADPVLKGDDDFGMTGNILFDRVVGSSIYTCTPGEYGRIGSDGLVARLCSHLKDTYDKKVYPIPVGGSNALGSWGYINAVDEMLLQWKSFMADAEKNDETTTTSTTLNHIVFACGSGGTAAGIAVGIALGYASYFQSAKSDDPSKMSIVLPKVHAIGVCDSPDYFYKYVADIVDGMGIDLPKDNIATITTEEFIRQNMIVHQGKGLGYAVSTPEERDFVTNFALETGIALDPVYSGKALYNFVVNVLEEDSDSFKNQNILFWHTGGGLGLFAEEDNLHTIIDKISPVRRLDIYGKEPNNGSIDISSTGDA